MATIGNDVFTFADLAKRLDPNLQDVAAVVEGWRKETLDIFGKDGETQFMQNVGRAEEVVKHFFNEDQRKVLTHYGLGNHPAFFAMCMAIAEGTGEDRLTSLGGAGAKGEKTLAQTWYPET